MICLLNDMVQNNVKIWGEEIELLRKLHNNSLIISETILISNLVFKSFFNDGYINDQYFDSIMELLNQGKFYKFKDLFFQVSLQKKCIGICDNIKVENNYTSIKYTLEKIYHSWNDEKTKAYKISNKIADNDCMPAVYIQPFYEKMFSLVTRSSTTGERTDEHNFKMNIHNIIDIFTNDLKEFLYKTENIIKRPSKVFFVSEDNKYLLCKIKDQHIIEPAYLNSINDYYENGLINKIQFASYIQPNYIARYVGMKCTNKKAIKRKGLTVSPGFALGKLIFRTSDVTKIQNEIVISIFDEVFPEDLELLNKSVGAIATSGGMTSHFGVVCRGLRLPAVIDNSLFIDEKNRVVKVNGKDIHEYSNVYIASSTPSGELYFSDEDFILDKEYVCNNSNICKIYYTIISLVNDIECFKNLSIEQQIHISTLIERFRKIGYVNA